MKPLLLTLALLMAVPAAVPAAAYAVPADEHAVEYVQVQAQPRDGIYALLRRYQLPTTTQLVAAFHALNDGRLSRRGGLLRDATYNLPIRKYTYNGRSIRSTLGDDDYSRAVRIRQYNVALQETGMKPKLYTADGQLWVPYHEMAGQLPVVAAPPATPVRRASMSTSTPAATPARVRTEPLFGPDHEVVTIKDQQLAGCVYYLMSGHGGPDPGAQGRYNGHTLSEDEYAYDVTLRLARRLMEHGATVYLIVQDDDGIRDAEILRNDRDERYHGGAALSRRQRTRLQQRADRVNILYDKHKATARVQRALMIHVDANHGRQATQKDVYFFHLKGSKGGQRMSRVLQQTIDEKYRQHQPNRGYSGSLNTRNLFMLRETKPVAVLVELGNIRHRRDQMRLLKVNNRQALANWFADGLIREAKQP